MKKIYVILILLLPALTFTQSLNFQQELYPFPVNFYGVEPQLGFQHAGAYYHFDFGDLDSDMDSDIILGFGGYEYYIENVGTNISPDFEVITSQLVTPFSGYICQAPTLCDIDNDLDLDIFIAGFDGYIIFYRNIGSTNYPNYVLIDSSFEDIEIIEGCDIDFADLDGDGDFDMFIGGGYGPYGGRLYYYRNIGTSTNYNFELITDYFCEIDVDENASPEFIDIDDDGMLELFLGEKYGKIYYYENTGTYDSLAFSLVTANYFGIDVGNMAVPRFCDIDGDGDYDLFVANESAGGNVDFVGDIDFYENIGTPTEAHFYFITSQYLFMDMSSCSCPYPIDFDENEIYDIMVGVNGGNFILLKNRGNFENPSLYFADSTYLDISLSYMPNITLGDLDGDDDLDMVAKYGSFTDYAKIFENVGTATEPVFNYYSTILSSTDDYYGVELCDIDDDEDLDLFIGDWGNRLEFWENTGSQYQPIFELENINYLNYVYQTGCPYPRFNDIDHDGDYDLFLMQRDFGMDECYIVFFTNYGGPQVSDLVATDTLFMNCNGARNFCLCDIDGDGDEDILVGDSGGAMLFFRNLEYNSVNREPETVNRSFALYPNYPNPFNTSTTIPFTLDRQLPVKVVVYNQLGQVVTTIINEQITEGSYQLIWNAVGISSGIYILKVETASGFRASKKLVLLK